MVVPLVVWFFFLVARATKALRANRKAYPAGIGRNVLRAFALVPIIATLDAAAFVGSLNWLVLDKLRLARSRPQR